MTWRSTDRGSSDYDYQQGLFPSRDHSGTNDKSTNDRADLSSGIWKRDSACAGQNGGYDRPLPDPKDVASGIRQISQILQELGLTIDVPVLWPKLSPEASNAPSDDTGRTKTITVGNGDRLTLGGMGGFELVDKNGMPVRSVKTIDSGADDAPVEHVLSNGAIYRSRGGWNHDESITWPNGDVVRFSDAGQFQSYEPKGEKSTSNQQPSDYPPTSSGGSDRPSPTSNQDGGDQGGFTFSNGDRFVTTAHGWELYTADGERVTKGAPDPNSAMDATRIPLSNGATLISGGWGVDSISYPGGEHISFSKNGTLRTVNGEPA